MRIKRIVALVVSVVALSAANAQAAVIGFAGVQVTVDGQQFFFEANGEGQIGIREFSVMSGQEILARFSIEALLDPDPSIAYGIAIVDFGAPSAFGFFFGTPIVPVTTPNVVAGAISGTLIDFTGDGVSLTPLGATVQKGEVGFPLTNMGVDVGAAFAAGAGAPGAVYAYGPFSVGPTPGPGPGPWTFLTVTSSFLLSGGGDTAALAGFVSIDPAPRIPEPASLSLIALGLSAMLARRRRT